MKSVLITGATGFIGSHLLRVLASRDFGERFTFSALARKPIPGWRTISDGRGSGANYHFNKHVQHELAEIDVLLHLGAYAPKSRADANNVGLCGTNISNTEYILSHLTNLKRVVFASSVDVYGSARPMTESITPSPQTLYGASKLYCEKLVEAWSTNGREKSCALLRIGHIYGPGEEAYRKFIPETIRRLLKQLPPSISTSGDELRSLMHVDDCCHAILNVLADEDVSGTMNIASAKPRSIRDIADMLVRVVEEIYEKPVPAWSTGDEPGQSVVVDVSAFERRYDLTEIDLMTGLRQEVLSFGK